MASWGRNNPEWEASLESIRFRSGSCDGCEKIGYHPIVCTVTMNFKSKTGSPVRASNLRLSAGRVDGVFGHDLHTASDPTNECFAGREGASIEAIFTLLAPEGQSPAMEEDAADVFSREKLGFMVKINGKGWILGNSGDARRAGNEASP